MSKHCSICERLDRSEIDNAILSSISLNDIADQFDLQGTDELKAHAMFHTGVLIPFNSSQFSTQLSTQPSSEDIVNDLGPEFDPGAVIVQAQQNGRMSLAQKMKLHEADMLTAVNHEYLVTLKALGRRINRLAYTSGVPEEDAVKLARLLSKSMVELYIGLGSEIRKNVATLTDVNQVLNGPQDQGANGLAALAAAIRSSSSVNHED